MTGDVVSGSRNIGREISDATVVADDVVETASLFVTGSEQEEAFFKTVDPFVLSSLEQMRKKLLDLTARNRLLNFPVQQKTAGLRIIDELPDQMAQLLLKEKSLKFKAIPEPSRQELLQHGYLEVDKKTGEDKRLKPDPDAREWAKVLGFDVSYDLPRVSATETETEDKHQDDSVQVLMYPAEMESTLRNIRTKSQTAIEESGACILYLVLGFLEWTEREDSAKTRLAPLFTIPVHLNRGQLDVESGTYQYTLTYTGEDIFPNLSLREKLAEDFALALPDFDEEELPDAYMERVGKLVRAKKPDWSVRRYGGLALLNFSKMLMYLDLDPRRWPLDGRNLVNHPIVQRFFKSAGRDESATVGAANEYRIDEISDIHSLFPLIDDADSSQHSALIDAVMGKNLVIEGPPGTGKSQTITNLIAAAMLSGKKVLFVAEKMAALDVVKRRLDRAGLGDFCLELHSHNSQKRKVLEDIDARVKNQARLAQAESIDSDIQLYEEKKDQLNRYVSEINAVWANTGMSIHEIFSGAARYREALNVNPVELHIDGLSGTTLTDLARRKLVEQVSEFQKVYRAMVVQLGDDQKITLHPWSGVENTDIQLFDADKVVGVLKDWQASIEQLYAQTGKTAETIKCAPEALATLQQCELVASDQRNLPTLTGLELYQALPLLEPEVLEQVADCLALYQKIQQHYEQLATALVHSQLAGFASNGIVPKLPDLHQATGASRDTSLTDIIRCTKALGKINSALGPFIAQLEEVLLALPSKVVVQLGPNRQGLKSVCKLFEVANTLDTDLIGSRSAHFDDELDALLADIEPRIGRLRSLHDSLIEQIKLDQLPDVQRLKVLLAQHQRGGIGKWFDGEWRQARKDLKALAISPDGKISDVVATLRNAIAYVDELNNLDEDRCKKALGEHYHGLKTDLERLKKLRRWVREVRREYGIGFGKAAEIGDALLVLEPRIFKGIKQLEANGFSSPIRQLLVEVEGILDIIPAIPAGMAADSSLHGENGLLVHLQRHLQDVLTPLQVWVKDESLTIEGIETAIEQLTELSGMQQSFIANGTLRRVFGTDGELGIGFEANNGNKLRAIESTLVLARHINQNLKSAALQQAFRALSSRAGFEQLSTSLNQLVLTLADESKARELFDNEVELSDRQWLDADEWDIAALLERNLRAIERPRWLNDWVNFVRIRNDMRQRGLEPLWHMVTERMLDIDQAKNALDLAVFDQLSREILQQRPHLARISGKNQQAIQSLFCEYDQKLKVLQRKRIASVLAGRLVPEGKSGGRKSEYTEMALIKNELGKKTRHIPIRQLVNRSANALVALKPCFMMGPMSAAQYLQPGELQFDLLVMDEASQVKPEDAMGVIARGAQLVVVGDPKQLPPTSFFDKQGTDDDDDDSAAINQTDSILDASLPLFDMRRLRWHYRSQHESLIAYSNRHFYDNDLVIFPSPFANSDEFGIKFTFVRGARFVNQYNLEEARVVAKAVVDHALSGSDESVGVVAMSSKQRDQIERSLEEICKLDSLAAAAVDKLRSRDDGLFIKNLENVQGDERDVIFISFTYGPSEIGGKTYQRFGPINSDVGWRRLNVLFTRSRKRMHAFSSMKSEDILISETSKRGVVALRNFLHFAEKGNMDGVATHTNRAPDSDFEIAVIDALYQAGFACDAQVGVAGFFVDIAVKDPGNPGRYLMAVECDGATYHSAKSARDRDRLRQEILERLGWRICRIWSTDWFSNPRGQLEPIIRELHKLKSEPVFSEYSEEATHVMEPVTDDYSNTISSAAEIFEVDGALGLGEQLEAFATDVVEREFSNTPRDRKLLRPSMIEALIEHRPVSKTEFVEKIPEYLRKSTEPAEAARYLDQILKMISGYEVEEGV